MRPVDVVQSLEVLEQLGLINMDEIDHILPAFDVSEVSRHCVAGHKRSSSLILRAAARYCADGKAGQPRELMGLFVVWKCSNVQTL